MKRLNLLLVLFLLLAVTFASAEESSILDNVKSVEDINALSQQDLDYLKLAYNENIDKVPSLVKRLIGGERINLFIERSNGEKIVFHSVLENSLMTELGRGPQEQATLKISSDEATVDQLLKGELTLGDALKEDKIRYEFESFWSRMVFGIFKLFI